MIYNCKKLKIFFIFFLFCSQLFAEKIVFSANRMSGQSGSQNTKTSLSGNAYIKTQAMEIQADEIVLSGDDYRYIKASGNVTGKNVESHMDFTCDSLEFDRITKIAELKGNVKLTDLENDVKTEAQIITYNQETEVTVLQIKVNLTQKDNICSGAYAVYYKTSQLLELSGNAQIRQKEDVFKAQYITLNMETQDIVLDGNVKGQVTETSKTENNSNQTSKEETEQEEDSQEQVEQGGGKSGN